MSNGAGYHKGREKVSKGSPPEIVRGRPGATPIKHKKKKKRLFSSGGPEGELNRLIPRGTATTQRMRYDLGTQVVSKRRQKPSPRGN